MYNAFLFIGAIRPTYSVYLGELAISPIENTRIPKIINQEKRVVNIKKSPALKMIIPVIMAFNGLNFVVTEDINN